jgi:hypothetical protein
MVRFGIISFEPFYLLPENAFLKQLQMQFALIEKDGNVYQLAAANLMDFYKEGLQSRG